MATIGLNRLLITKFAPVALFLLVYGKGFCQIGGFSAINRAHGFIENKGQIHDQAGHFNPQVKFIFALSSGMKIQLREDGFSYDTYTESSRTAAANSGFAQILGRHLLPSLKEIKCHRVDVNLVGAGHHPQIIADDTSIAMMNYYTPGTGANGVRAKSFRKLTYKDIYNGIDLVFLANSNDSINPFEYFFVVNPGADAGLIKLRYRGALKTDLDNGRISIVVNRGTIRERIPESYLNTGNPYNLEEKRAQEHVAVAYKSFGNDEYGFRVPAYNRSKVLVIDPTPDLIWGTYYGGFDNDFADALAKDANGNLFFSGTTDAQVTLATAGAYQTVLEGYSDGLIAKFDNGGSPIWCTYYGGSGEDEVQGIKIDHEGNVVATGQTYSHDNISTPGAFQTVDNAPGMGLPTAFVVKFDNNGNRLWATYAGGNYADVAQAVDIDSKDNIFITGFTESTAGIASPGAAQTVWAGDTVTRIPDAFLTKFDKNGARIWSTYHGGEGYDLGLGVCVDLQDNVIITGSTASSTGMHTAGCWQPALASGPLTGTDAYLAKFDNNGHVIWATYYGGELTDVSYCVAVDQGNNIVFGGFTNSTTNIASSGAMQPTRVPGIDRGYEAYVAKFTADGQRIWGTYYGNGGSDIVMCITTDQSNNVYLGGTSASAVNIATTGSYQPQPQSPTTNTFVSKMNGSGVLQWGTFYGIPGGGWADGIVELPDGSVVITGVTESNSNIATCGAFRMNWANFNDIFLGKFGENVTHGPSISINTTTTGPVCPNTPITFNATADNGGTTPVYQWLLNGVDVGANNASYTAGSLANGDKVSCFLNSNSVCVTTDTASSNVITVAVIIPGVPTIGITASADTICLGTKVTFSAAANTTSTAPTFRWMVNGANVGASGPSYASSTLGNGDLVSCSVTDDVCNVSSTGYSNKIQMMVNTNILTPSVSIGTAFEAVCPGTPVTFIATPSDAGNTPTYQWTVNGIASGSNSNSLRLSNLMESDTVVCVLTPGSQVCWNAAEVISNTINLTVYPAVGIVFSPSDISILAGASVQLEPRISGNVVGFDWTPAGGLSASNIQNPFASPDTPTLYQLTVTSVDNCQAVGDVKVDVLRNLHMPNALGLMKAGKIPFLEYRHILRSI